MQRDTGLALALSLAVALLGAGACQKEAQPPRPPPKCAKVERGSDRVVEVLLCAEADADEDGVDDVVDLCPQHKETVNGVADKDGCPDPDRDQDLFVDYEDTCPDDKGEPPDGCPGQDSDSDLISDHLDSCPHEKEDYDGDRDDDGCPDGSQLETVAKALSEQLWQRARIDVRRGRAAASKAGNSALEELVREVATRPADVKRVRIVGYASLREARRGRAKDLAKERVKLVEARLAATGVDSKAFERAIYPLKDRKERVGRVDVMVFLDLNAAMAGEAVPGEERPDEKQPDEKQPDETKPAEKKPDEKKPDEKKPAETKPAETKPAEKKTAEKKPDEKPDDDWDAQATEPYPEPEAAPAEEDWDLVGTK